MNTLRRVAFNYTPMEPSDPGNPEQLTQLFFAGTHSGVGGGDLAWKETALIALHFLIDEIRRRGLGIEFDENVLPPFGDPAVPAIDVKYTGTNWVFNYITGIAPRLVPSVDVIHSSAILRYQKESTWRPPALKHLHDDLLAATIDNQ